VPPVPSKVEHAVYFVYLSLGKYGFMWPRLSRVYGG
jgi:hypothetical protein